MRCACIDIGSNTTRLLVADVREGALVPVLELRTFTRLGSARRDSGALPEEVVGALAAIVVAQARAARTHETERLRVVATAAVRRAANGAGVCAALGSAAGVPVELLAEQDEARLAFAGATAGIAGGAAGAPGAGAPGAGRGAATFDRAAPVAVLDVGGGSSQLVVGTLAAGPAWSISVRLGSGDLAARHLQADPPAAAALTAIRADVAAALGGLAPPAVERALAVGGSATSLRRLAGPRLDGAGLARALAVLVAEPAAAVAQRTGIAPERVRLLPAGILVLEGFAARLGPLEVACGGLREGVVRELASA